MKVIQLLLQRLNDNGKSTIGAIFRKDIQKVLCFSGEDEFRAVKVAKETRIPAGYYEMKIRREDTPLTIKHRDAYGPWFKYHIEICNVPGFSSIYSHAGNKDTHSDGCILNGDILYNNEATFENILATSVEATRRFYEYVYPVLDGGGKAYIEIRDEKFLFT